MMDGYRYVLYLNFEPSYLAVFDDEFAKCSKQNTPCSFYILHRHRHRHKGWTSFERSKHRTLSFPSSPSLLATLDPLTSFSPRTLHAPPRSLTHPQTSSSSSSPPKPLVFARSGSEVRQQLAGLTDARGDKHLRAVWVWRFRDTKAGRTSCKPCECRIGNRLQGDKKWEPNKNRRQLK